MLMISCAFQVSCASNKPIVVIKCVDYGDGKDKCEPSDRDKWMWVTYETAKRQLKWLNR